MLRYMLESYFPRERRNTRNQEIGTTFHFEGHEQESSVITLPANDNSSSLVGFHYLHVAVKMRYIEDGKGS